MTDVVTHIPLTSRTPVVFKGSGASEPVAQHIARLQLEARNLATEHVIGLIEALQDIERMATEASNFGESVPPGVRDICRKLAEESAGKAQSINAIMERKP